MTEKRQIPEPAQDKPFVERVCSDGQAIVHTSATRPETQFVDAGLWL